MLIWKEVRWNGAGEMFKESERKGNKLSYISGVVVAMRTKQSRGSGL